MRLSERLYGGFNQDRISRVCERTLTLTVVFRISVLCSPAAQRPRPSDGASDVVSAGSKTHRDTAAGPAVIHQRVRAASEQFNFLVAALEELRIAGRIDGFEILAPPVGPEVRAGLRPGRSYYGTSKSWLQQGVGLATTRLWAVAHHLADQAHQ